MIVDRDTGVVTVLNATPVPFDLSGYSISSDRGLLDPSFWTSIADSGDADSGGSIDEDGIWGLDASTRNKLSEYVTADELDGRELAPGDAFHLGNIWARSPWEELDFEYRNTEQITKPGIVKYAGTSIARGDFDLDGDVDGDDLDVLQANFGADQGATHSQGDADGDGDIDEGDILVWQSQYGVLHRPDGNGVTTDPEPTTITGTLLVAACMAIGNRLFRHVRIWMSTLS